MIVSNIMSKAVIINEDLTLKEIADVIAEKGVDTIIVIKDNKIEGIITDGDIIKNINKKDVRAFKIMSKNVITINEKESIDNAALMMAENKIKRLPVLSKGKLVGLITSTDIIENSDELNEAFFFG